MLAYCDGDEKRESKEIGGVMQKTKIEWTDYVWNPIKGLCPVDCKLPDGRSYCYGKRIYERFNFNPKERFSLLECAKPLHLKKPSKIFVCSTFELFHPVISDRQRELIFRVIKKCPQHTFQILTKFPQNIDRAMPDNVHLGVSITNEGDLLKTWRAGRREAKVHFISIEPMLEHIDPANLYYKIKWIIIGRLTGFGNEYNPKKEWIEDWVKYADWHDVPIFLKNNLKSIWGKDLIQEFPNSNPPLKG